MQEWGNWHGNISSNTVITNSTINSGQPLTAKWPLGGPLQNRGPPNGYLVAKFCPVFVVEVNNYSITEDDPMSLTLLLHGAPHYYMTPSYCSNRFQLISASISVLIINSTFVYINIIYFIVSKSCKRFSWSLVLILGVPPELAALNHILMSGQPPRARTNPKWNPSHIIKTLIFLH